MSSELVYLQCIKQCSKLRVRIVSPGYYSDANCQFPRNLRAEGTMYTVPIEDIRLVYTRSKYFYSVRSKNIVVVNNDQSKVSIPPNLVIYQDQGSDECAICLDQPKDTIINPCGHFYTCHACCSKLEKCPICRTKIISKIDKKLIG